MKFKSFPTAYEQLNAKQKEQYNFHFVAQKLIEHGYDIVWLSNDWQGADFLAVREEETLKVQLKASFTLKKSYIGKDLWVAFRKDQTVYMYKHDTMLAEFNLRDSATWNSEKGYHWRSNPSKDLLEKIIEL